MWLKGLYQRFNEKAPILNEDNRELGLLEKKGPIR